MVAADPTAQQAMLARIDDPDDDVQISVVSALSGAAAQPAVREALVRKLSAKLHIRNTASWALHPLGMDAALEQSIADFLLDPARTWIASPLEVLCIDHDPCTSCPLGNGNSAVVARAVRQLLEDPNPKTRLMAA